MKIGKIAIGAVLALLFCLLPLTAFSLDVTVGIKGGVGVPHFSGPDYKETLDLFGINTQAKLGFSAGAFVTLGLFDLVAFQPEAYYSFLGGRYGDDTGSLVEDAPVLQIPLLLKGRVESGGLVITPLAGPVVMLKAGDWKIKAVDADGNETPLGTYTDDEVPDFILGVVAGIGFELDVGGNIVSFEARYLLGLTPRFEEDAFALYDRRQNNIEVLVGIGFPVIR
jgi:hypothetical protein